MMSFHFSYNVESTKNNSKISMFTVMRGTWLYFKYIDNLNNLNKFKLPKKNFKLKS